MNTRSLNVFRAAPAFTALAAFATLGLGQNACAQSSYQVTVDTTSLSGQSGFVDFQFNPGNATSLAATASIPTVTETPTSLFSGTSLDTGGATGSLPGPLLISNSTGFNDLFQGITYGQTLGFTVTFTGPALNPPTPGQFGSTFLLALFGSDGATPVLTTDRNGDLFDINLNPSGSSGVANFSETGGNGQPLATVAPLAAAPEPSETAAFGVGVVALILLGLRAGKRRPVAEEVR